MMQNNQKHLFDFFCIKHYSITIKLNNYSKIALKRVWKTVGFSKWMTSILHNSNENNLIERNLNKLELAELKKSEKAQKLVAEQYVGAPY